MSIISLAWVLPKDVLLKMWPVIRNIESLVNMLVNMRDQDVMEVKRQCLRTRKSLPQVLSISGVPRAHNGPHLLNFTVGILACLLVMRCKSKVTVAFILRLLMESAAAPTCFIVLAGLSFSPFISC